MQPRCTSCHCASRRQQSPGRGFEKTVRRASLQSEVNGTTGNRLLRSYGISAGGNILFGCKVDGSNKSHLLGRHFDSESSLLDPSNIDILQSPRPNSSIQTILKCEYGILHQVPRVQIRRNDSVRRHLKLFHHKYIVNVKIGCQTGKERATDTGLGKTGHIL